MSIHTGSCICSKVNYKLNSDALHVVNCHCNFCRSHTGSVFSTYAVFPHASLEITEGNEMVSSYKVGEGIKHFCNACGTPIFNLNHLYPGVCMVYFGTLKDTQNFVPSASIWCESKLPWVDKIASIRSYPHGFEK